jgi:hypothetical protein
MSTEYVEREGKVFEFGDYPDKGFSLTPGEFAAANPEGGAGATVDLEHFRKAHPLRGKLGSVVSTEVRGNALFARVRWPKPLDDLIGEDSRKVSCHFDPDKKLVQLDLVVNPRIPDAALFSAADPEAPVIEAAEGDIKAPAFEFAAYAAPVPMEAMRLVAQDFHDIAANCWPGLCSGQATFARGDMTRRHWQLVHTKAMNHGATCKGTGRFSEESEMSDTEKPRGRRRVQRRREGHPAEAELAELQAANRRIQEDSILKDAAVFAENEVRAFRATVPEREGLKPGSTSGPPWMTRPPPPAPPSRSATSPSPAPGSPTSASGSRPAPPPPRAGPRAPTATSPPPSGTTGTSSPATTPPTRTSSPTPARRNCSSSPASKARHHPHKETRPWARTPPPDSTAPASGSKPRSTGSEPSRTSSRSPSPRA